MKSVSDLLFGTLHDNKPLFKNQLDLVQHLLSTPGSAYFVDSSFSNEDISRAQGRLRTYISQLLSNNVVRNITEDFKNSLALVLSSKLPDEPRSRILHDILIALQQKNAALAPKEENIGPRAIKNSLHEDIDAANYVVVITARPIDMDAAMKESGFSIRKSFFEDLVKSILSPTDSLKYYRFNFPSSTYGELFWAGLEKIMSRFLYNLPESKNYFRFLYYEKFSITTESLRILENFIESKPSMTVDETQIHKRAIMSRIAREIVIRLNRNKIIMVFYNDHPIFSVPLIAVNPNESTAKVYGLLDLDEQPNVVYKFSQENILLWRIFFWDKIKASDNGIPVNHPQLSNPQTKS